MNAHGPGEALISKASVLTSKEYVCEFIVALVGCVSCPESICMGNTARGTHGMADAWCTDCNTCIRLARYEKSLNRMLWKDAAEPRASKAHQNRIWMCVVRGPVRFFIFRMCEALVCNRLIAKLV